MKVIECECCGAKDLFEENGYLICRYCGTKYVITKDDQPEKKATIDLNKDVAVLLQKCVDDPSRAAKYAQLILEIDPNNDEAKKYLNEQTGNGGGCYIATAVYHSYDCPQVWTLRRYRDYTLAETWYGRAFIRIYYAISPTLVKWFGHTDWFKKMWKGKLDRMVANLKAGGVEDTPYEDRKW